MKKYFLLVFLFGISSFVFSQQITKVEIVQSETYIGDNRGAEPIMRLRKPVFKHDNSILTCDSANFFTNRNSFEAYGRVHINQADTIDIYSDLLNYNGNTKIAILTNNVKMVDKDAVLTTDHLIYNMASRVGQYRDGGKIVNGQNTLTSTNGYYFSNSNDAYFRYNVKVKSPEVLIVSDTLRYNSISKIAFFYGPTHIYGKDDTLYTENGTYNTVTDQAAFGKNNLYAQNSKTLKGDSLFYDRNAGYGRAVKNIVFKDTAQKVELRGDLGYYLKKDESIEVTRNAYVVFETETDSLSKDSTFLSADTLFSKVISKGELYKLRELRKPKIPEPADDSFVNVPEDIISTDSVIIADSLVTDSLKQNETIVIADSLVIKNDVIVKDSLIKDMSEERLPLLMSKKEQKRQVRKKERPKLIPANLPESEKPIEPLVVKTEAKTDSTAIIAYERQLFMADSLKKDSIRFLETDTAKVRIISAWRNVKLFKSDLQSKSDSAFFSYSDSTLRIYYSPIVWAQGSQIVADTMYMQMKNGKMDNMDMIRNAIVVSADKDSVYFNQVAGKTMKGYFVNEKLDRIFVEGNAESIYFPEDTVSNRSLIRTLAARMRINFSNDSLMSILFLRKPEMTYYPFEQTTEELKTLPNFSWKPKERPKSKEEVIVRHKPAAMRDEKESFPKKKE